MKVLVYLGPGQKALKDRPQPQLAALTDAIVRIIKTTICGVHLHILKGDVPTCSPGASLATRATASSNKPARRSRPSSRAATWGQQ